jgi:YcxB-like protein
MITAEYQLTADEFAEAQAGALRSVLGRKIWFLYLLMSTLPVGLAFTLLGDATLAQQFRPAMILGAAATLFFALNQTGVWHRAQFKRNKALQAPTRLRADNLALSLANSRGNSTTNWTSFTIWKELQSSFILYPQKGIMFIVPKRAFAAESLDGFRKLLQDKIAVES